MLRASLATLALLFFAATASAQDTEPRPAERTDVPIVLVLPFESLAADSRDDSLIARAIGRSLLLDLSHARQFHAVGADNVAADRDAALDSGRVSAARFVVWGTVQYVEGRVRVIAELLDVERGESAGRFKVTGTLRELFEVQDILFEQVQRRLLRLSTKAGADDDRAEPVEAVEVTPSPPLRVASRDARPDWLDSGPASRDDDALDRRYNYAREPYWLSSYPNAYSRYGSGGYYGSYRRAYRPLYNSRVDDYTYRGIPDRRPSYGYGFRGARSFDCPVPLRWFRRH